MTVLLLFFRFLEVLFFVGILGSAIVIVITTVEDFAVLFERDERAPGIADPAEPIETHTEAARAR